MVPAILPLPTGVKGVGEHRTGRAGEHSAHEASAAFESAGGNKRQPNRSKGQNQRCPREIPKFICRGMRDDQF